MKVLVLLLCSALAPAALGREPKGVLEARSEALRSLLAALDDVAVKGGSPDLRARHAAFKAQIATYRGKAAAPTEDAAVEDLADKLAKKAPRSETAALARAVHRRLVTAFELVAAPAQTPDRATAAALFKEHCARCHGAGGAGDGALAAKIEPRLASFAAPDLHAEGAPFRYYDRIAAGVAGSAMPAFRGKIDERGLWSLAFYVASLPYPAEPDARGAWRKLSDADRDRMTKAGLTLSRLSLDGNDALAAWVASALPDANPERRAEVLRALRAAAPFTGDVAR